MSDVVFRATMGYGTPGPQGRSLQDMTPHYLAINTTEDVTRATPGWTTEPQVTTETNKYLFVYYELTWDEEPETTYIEPRIQAVHPEKGEQGEQGDQGDAARSIVGITPYYLVSAVTEGITRTTPGWSTVPPVITAELPYLYRYTDIEFTLAPLHEYAEPHIIGKYGDQGNGIASATTTYASSNQGTNQGLVTGWGVDLPVVPQGHYLWTKTEITFEGGAKHSVYTVSRQAIDSEYVQIYGCRFEGSNPVGTRTHAAVGMIANVGVDDQIVVNDFDNVSFFQRPRCLVYHDSAGNVQVMAYEGEPGFNLQGAIFPPYTEKAQVYYEQKPFYWNGNLDWPQVTATPLEGFELAPAFKSATDKVYLPSYWLGLDNGKACSLSGTHPEYSSINGSMATARTYHARAHLETMAVRISEYVLQLVEFATRDVQNVMTGAMSNRYNGDDISILAEDGVNRIVMANASADQFVVGQTICIGTTKNGSNIATRVVITAIDVYDASNKAISFDGPPLNIPLGAFISTRAWRSGATDIVKASSGSPVSNSNGRYPCIWRGKVDPWAMAYSGISDVLIQRSGAGTVEDPYTYNAYQLADPTLYNNGVIDDNWKKVDYELSPSDGYVTQMGKDPKSPAVRMPTAVGGASTTYYASSYYYGRYAVGAVFVGGVWNDGRRCSPVYFILSSAPSSSDIYRLARLFVTPL